MASIFFGTYILPRKHSKLSVLDYQFWMSWIIPVLFSLFLLATRSRLIVEARYVALALSCGVLWALGAVAYSMAVDRIGIIRSTPVKNLGPILTTLYGIAIFHEFTFRQPIHLAAAILGSVLMSFAAVAIGRCQAPQQEDLPAFHLEIPAPRRRQLVIQGFVLSFAAALCFSSYSIPLKMLFRAGYTAIESIFWMGAAVPVATWLAYGLAKREWLPRWPGRSEVMKCQIAGACWVGGGGLGALAMQFIPMSISWPITNLSTLVTLGAGAWVYREVHLDKHQGEFAGGTIAYTIGVLLLGFAVAGANQV